MKHIIVSGGGIGGLTFAVAAKRAGFDVTVLERDENIVRSNAGGGLGLWPPSLEVMRRIGALELLRERGSFMPPPAYCTSGGAILAQPTPHFSTRFPILCVERSDLLDVLMRCCAREGVTVMSGCECTGHFSCDRSMKVQVSVAGQRQLMEADVLVGADGIHSHVRAALLSAATRPAPEHCGYAYFRSSVPVCERDDTSGEATMWHSRAFEAWGGGGIRFGFVPMKPPSVFWFAAVPIGAHGLRQRSGAHRLNLAERGWLLDILRDWKGPETGEAPMSIHRLVELSHPEEILRTDIFKISGVTKFRWSNPTGNVILLGDACHATAPNLAQGAGLSIEDAMELASALQIAALSTSAGASSVPTPSNSDPWRHALRTAVDQYEQARKPRALTVQRLADLVATVGQARGIFAVLRNLAMSCASASCPALTSRIFEEVVSHSVGGGLRQVTWECPKGASAPTTLLESVIGAAAFREEVPSASAKFRAARDGGRGVGRVSVERGVSLLARVIARLAQLPPSVRDEPFEAAAVPSVDAHREWWTRRFGFAAYTTSMSRVRHLGPAVGGSTGLVLTEGIGGPLDGVIRFGYRPTAVRDGQGRRGIHFAGVGVWVGDIFRLPLPQALLPSSEWTEYAHCPCEGADDDSSGAASAKEGPGWDFEGRIRLPRIVGGAPLLAYRGCFTPDVQPCVSRAGSKQPPPPLLHAVVLGGTGFLGRQVCAKLLRAGWNVSVPTRRRVPRQQQQQQWSAVDGEGSIRYVEFSWEPSRREAAGAALAKAVLAAPRASHVVIINLAGENPGSHYWTPPRMRRILQSRLDAIAAIGAGLVEIEAAVGGDASLAALYPAAVLQASATGIYGDCVDEVRDTDSENTPPPSSDPPQNWEEISSPLRRGRRFRVQCCEAIESAAAALTQRPPGTPAAAVGVPKVVNLRIGMVLGAGGGVIPHFQTAVACGASRLGSGQQLIPWIHIRDAATIVETVARRPSDFGDDSQQLSFALNVCAPRPVPCREMLQHLWEARRVCGSLSVLSPPPCVPVPRPLLEHFLGPSCSVVLDGQGAVPARLRQKLSPEAFGALFEFADLRDALHSWDCAVPSRFTPR